MKQEENLNKIVEPLLLWYQENRRELPWRFGKNPYHIWLSEIMLQQTRIEAVKIYYHRFITELPTILSLAEVEEERLLKLWEGLGYYTRARNLKKAAIMIKEEYQGKMPSTYEELRMLPGIGDYTAGAIASIAFQERIPAVDGNVLRVVSRVLGSKEDILLPATKKKITELLKKIMPKESGMFNEALMELGETICIPNGEPLCDLCPLKENCIAQKKNLIDEIPVREKKLKRKIENRTVFLLYSDNQIAIGKRNKNGLLANMYEFPNIEGIVKEKQIEDILKEWDLEIESVEKTEEAKHVFSHIEWHMIGYKIKVKNKNQYFQWVTRQEIQEKYAIPTAFSKFKKQI